MNQPTFDAWIENSMTRVFPRARPAPASARLEAHISLAAGEYQSLQIVLRPKAGQELRDVRVEISPLDGNTRIDSQHLEWQQVGYVRVETLDGYRRITPNVERIKSDGAEVPGWWPDPLLPVSQFQVASEFAQPIWITVYAPPGTPPGTCSGSITIFPANTAPLAIRLHVIVRGFTLPPGAGHFPTAFALHEDLLQRVYGRLDEAMRLQWGDFVLRHRLNPGCIYRTQPPVVSDLEHFLEHGMNAYPCLCHHPSRKSDDVGGLPPELLEKLSSFLESLKKSKHADRLFDQAYFYGFDEFPADRLHHLRDAFRTIREQFGLPTLTTSQVPQTPADLRKLNVDRLCPLTSWLDAAKAARVREAGHQMWTYISLEPDPPLANIRLDCPLIEARVLLWQMYREQVDGLLYWGLNWWTRARNDHPIDPSQTGPFLDWSVTTNWKDTDGLDKYRWLHGDGVLLYPGVNGPIGSIRLANLRDGLQDYEYLRLLSQVTGRPADSLRACEPVTTGWTKYSRDPHVLAAERERVAQRIVAQLS